MKRFVCLVGAVAFLLMACSPSAVDGQQVLPNPTPAAPVTEPVKTQPPTPAKNTDHNYPKPWGSLAAYEPAHLTIQNSKGDIVGGAAPSAKSTIPLDDHGYQVEILLNKRYKVEGLPKVESQTWRFLSNSGASWATSDGETVFRFYVSSTDGFKSEAPVTTPLEVPVTITLLGVKDGDLTISMEFEFTPKDMSPKSRYGITYEGKTVDDSRLWETKPEWVNKNLELVVFSMDNELAADYHVALCDIEKKQTHFVADLSTFSGLTFWTGWLNDEEFFVANNYNLAVYGIGGTKTVILKLADVTHRNAIHGLAWSKARQTMAVLYGDGKSGAIELRLVVDDFSSFKTVGVVDRQDWYRGGSECFPMQDSPMAWDDKGERLAFTKTKNHVLAIYDHETGVIEDRTDESGIAMIEYDPTLRGFTVQRNFQINVQPR